MRPPSAKLLRPPSAITKGCTKSHPRRRRPVGSGRCPVRAQGSKVRFGFTGVIFNGSRWAHSPSGRRFTRNDVHSGNRTLQAQPRYCRSHVSSGRDTTSKCGDNKSTLGKSTVVKLTAPAPVHSARFRPTMSDSIIDRREKGAKAGFE
jgi:hypothetical protein